MLVVINSFCSVLNRSLSLVTCKSRALLTFIESAWSGFIRFEVLGKVSCLKTEHSDRWKIPYVFILSFSVFEGLRWIINNSTTLTVLYWIRSFCVLYSFQYFPLSWPISRLNQNYHPGYFVNSGVICWCYFNSPESLKHPCCAHTFIRDHKMWCVTEPDLNACSYQNHTKMIKYGKNIWKLPQYISKLLKVNIFECAVLNSYIMELKRISILWLLLFCVNIHFQIPCILIEDTTATTAPPAKAPPWHHQTPTTDKVALMTSSIFL